MRALTVAVTGGIGSGKSLALASVAKLGATVVDVDEIARSQAKPGGAAYRRIVTMFGKSILNADKTIDRQRLGAIVFRDAAKRRALEKVTHPLIIKEMSRRLQAAKSAVAYAAVPLLFETGLEKRFDVTMTIEAPEATRIKRVAKRDTVAHAHVADRIAAQLPEKERVARADVVLRSDRSKARFSAEVRSYHRALELLRLGAAAR